MLERFIRSKKHECFAAGYFDKPGNSGVDKCLKLLIIRGGCIGRNIEQDVFFIVKGGVEGAGAYLLARKRQQPCPSHPKGKAVADFQCSRQGDHRVKRLKYCVPELISQINRCLIKARHFSCRTLHFFYPKHVVGLLCPLKKMLKCFCNIL